jgi:hypothetical protein
MTARLCLFVSSWRIVRESRGAIVAIGTDVYRRRRHSWKEAAADAAND